MIRLRILRMSNFFIFTYPVHLSCLYIQHNGQMNSQFIYTICNIYLRHTGLNVYMEYTYICNQKGFLIL